MVSRTNYANQQRQDIDEFMRDWNSTGTEFFVQNAQNVFNGGNHTINNQAPVWLDGHTSKNKKQSRETHGQTQSSPFSPQPSRDHSVHPNINLDVPPPYSKEDQNPRSPVNLGNIIPSAPVPDDQPFVNPRQMTSSNDKLEQLRMELAAVKDNRDYLKGELSIAKDNRDYLKGELNIAKENRDYLKTELIKLRESLTIKDSTIALLQKQNEELQKKNEDQLLQIVNLSDTMSALLGNPTKEPKDAQQSSKGSSAEALCQLVTGSLANKKFRKLLQNWHSQQSTKLPPASKTSLSSSK